MRVFACEIAGWGSIGALYSATAIVSDGSLITVNVAGGIGSLFADEIGADIGVVRSAVFTGRYTLQSVTSNTLVLVDRPNQGPRADFGPTQIRLEDPYRLCTGVPQYVTGSNAIARWFVVVRDIPPTLGASLPVTGGVSTVDTLRLSIIADVSLAPLRDLWRLQVPTLQGEGRLSLLSTSVSADGEQVVLTLTEPTPFVIGTYLLHVDEEALAFTAASNASLSTLICTRAVLGTFARPHSKGTIITTVPITYIGARVAIGVYDESSNGRSDFIYSMDGVLDAPSYDAGTTSYSLPIRTELINAYAGSTRGRLTATATITGVDVFITQRDVFQKWQWVDIGGMAYQIGATGDVTEDPATGNVTRRYSVNLYRSPANPVIIDVEQERDAILDALGYFQVDPYSYTFVDELGDYAYVFRAQTIPLDLLSDRGDPVPCSVITNRADTYATATLLSTDPQQLVSRGFAECDAIAAILQVLCSTGTGNNRGALDNIWGGYNGTVDVLPAHSGLGIPQERLYEASFLPSSFRRSLPVLGGLIISAEDTEDLSQWLETKLLKPLHLALTTRKDGRIALVDLATLPDIDSAIAVDLRTDTRAAGNAATPDVSVAWDIGGVVSGVRVSWFKGEPPLPFELFPTESEIASAAAYSLSSRVSVVVRGNFGSGGRTAIMERIASGSLDLDPGWLVYGDETVESITASASAYMSQQGIPRLRIQATITETGTLEPLQLGDIVALTADPIPGESGQRGLTQYARVYRMQRNILNRTMRVDFLVIGRTPFQPRWVASGRVTGSASNTAIGIEFNAYTSDNTRFALDISAFRIGDAVLLCSATHEVLCTNVPEIIALDATTSTITLDTAFDDGSPLTPVEGQIVIVAPRDDQPSASEPLRGWLDYGTNGIDNANRTRWGAS